MTAPESAIRESAMEARLCAISAAADDQDPIGTTGRIDRLMLVETPMPWTDVYTADAEGTVQQRIRATQRPYLDGRHAAGLPITHQVYCVGPDPEWSVEGSRRVIVAERPAGPANRYEMREYLFPGESTEVVALAEAVLNDSRPLDEFDAHRIEAFTGRDLLVCTHGQVDICCAKLGIPTYRRARQAYPQVRAWRTSHFGGHRFAPTVWDLPSGYKWGFLDDDSLGDLIDLAPNPARLHARMRGWTGVPAPVHLLDRMGFDRWGWDWLDYRRAGEVLNHDTEARRWRVRLDFESPAGDRGRFEGEVRIARDLPNLGCGPHWGELDATTPEYALESFSDLESFSEE